MKKSNAVCQVLSFVILFACILINFKSALATDGTERWTFQIDSLANAIISPAVGSDGTIYAGFGDRICMHGDGTSGICEYGYLYAINPDGTLKWKTQLNVTSTASVGADNTIYVGCAFGKLCAINEDGTLKWEFQTGANIVSFPALGNDGTIYVGSTDHHLYALHSDGTVKWAFETGASINASPAIASDGTVYIGSGDKTLYALAPDKTLKWIFKTEDAVWSYPAIGADGSVYIGSNDDNIYALSPDGTLKWSYATGDDVWTSPVIGNDGTVFAASKDGKLYALNSDGELKWFFETNSYISYSSPTIGSDGVIYIGSTDNYLYALDPNGTLKWKYTNGVNLVETSPLIGSDGTVYIKIWGRIHAINGSSAGLADSSWPVSGHDQEHTGVASLPSDSGFSVSPSGVALGTGKTAVLNISGGTGPYQVSLSDDSVADFSLNENEVIITGFSQGNSTLTIKDSKGDSVLADINVTNALIPVGNVISGNLKIGAVINAYETGPVEARWHEGGKDTTDRGDKVIWGYFYADSSDVSWGSEQNPEVFVKIWFDKKGRTDANYFHVSVPNIEIFTGFTGNEAYDVQDMITMNSRRYVRHYHEDSHSRSEAGFEDGRCAYAYRTGCRYEAAPEEPSGTETINSLFIGSVIHTEEKGAIEAIWKSKGRDTTSRGDEVVWGYFHADPAEVSWGSAENPELFVKIWSDVSGMINVNYIHVSVPPINVYSDYPDDGSSYDKADTTYTDNRYIRHDFHRESSDKK